MILIGWLQQILNKIGKNDDAASMSDTLFAGQQKIHDDIAALNNLAASEVNVARKGVAFTVVFPIWKNDGTLISGATDLDSEISKDGGAFADCTNEAAEIGSSGVYTLTLITTEMNADIIASVVQTSTPGAVYPTFIIYTKS